LGLQLPEPEAMTYLDATNIPAWAIQAVGETNAAGLLFGRTDGAFWPNEPITAGELAATLNRLLNYFALQQHQEEAVLKLM